jgi:hypothetical protein
MPRGSVRSAGTHGGCLRRGARVRCAACSVLGKGWGMTPWSSRPRPTCLSAQDLATFPKSGSEYHGPLHMGLTASSPSTRQTTHELAGRCLGETTGETTLFTASPERGIVAVTEVMMCPPAGRGLPGALYLLENGRAVWLSETQNALGKPMFAQEMQCRDIAYRDVRFGGRVNLDGGYYLAFGRKSVARAFLGEAREIAASV